MASSAFSLCRATTLLIPYIFLATLAHPASLSSGTKPTGTFCFGRRSQTSSPAVTAGEVERFLGAVSDVAHSSLHRSYNASLHIDAQNRTMYAVAQCRPDVPASDCAACLAASSWLLAAGAASCADAAVWHEYDRCFFRYSDRDTSLFREDELAATVFNSSGRPARHGRAAVTGLLAAVMDRLDRSMQKRRFLGSTRAGDGVAWGWGAANSSAGQVYGVARCAPGIARVDCGRCLRGALAVAERDYNGSAGMHVLRLSCTARYESYRFYEDSPDPDTSTTTVTQKGGYVRPVSAGAPATQVDMNPSAAFSNSTNITTPISPPPATNGLPAGTNSTVPSTSPPPAASPPDPVYVIPSAGAKSPRAAHADMIPSPAFRYRTNITTPISHTPAANGPAASPPAQPQTTSHRRINKTLILLIVLIGTGVAVGSILLIFCSHRRRRQNRRDVVDGMPGEDVYIQGEEHLNAEDDNEDEESTTCQPYSYEILEVATQHFSNSNELGSGGFGTVYKGTLENGKVAVKRLNDSKRSLAELEREVSIVAKLRHENLVRFLGYCFKDEGRLLVYEYLPNNSLDKFWNKVHNVHKLDWERWFNIIEGVARGLQFLHSKGVIHRDLKPHNVLLDENFNPKIADFDLVKVYNKERTHESTQKAAGTFGYMAPECTSGRKFLVSIKSDVYSYGVLVLEIITRRKIHTFEGHNSEGLVEYVWEHWTKRRLCDVVDSNLNVEGQRQAQRCVHVALLCVQSDRSRRPTMEEVIDMLSTRQDSELPAPSLPGYLHPMSASGRPVLRPLPCFRC